MEVVINIPQKAYEQIVGFPQQTAGVDILILHKIIQDGKVLPKGHGALKDADKLAVAIAMIRDRWNYYGNEYESAMFRAYDNSVDEIIDATTIIEADEEEAEE